MTTLETSLVATLVVAIIVIALLAVRIHKDADRLWASKKRYEEAEMRLDCKKRDNEMLNKQLGYIQLATNLVVVWEETGFYLSRMQGRRGSLPEPVVIKTLELEDTRIVRFAA